MREMLKGLRFHTFNLNAICEPKKKCPYATVYSPLDVVRGWRSAV
jgi:hypothetical protein